VESDIISGIFEESSREQNLFEIEIFCYFISKQENYFTSKKIKIINRQIDML